jgi:TPR repeat protein
VRQRIKTFLAGGLLALALLSAGRAGPLEDGQAAFDRGDYETALRLWRPLADQLNSKAQTSLGLMYRNATSRPENGTARLLTRVMLGRST